MSCYVVNGKNIISGEIKIQGAKNSVLPILSATVLIDGVSIIHNCPDISDTDITVEILEYLGCKVKRDKHTVVVDATDVNKYDIPDYLMNKLRSSVIFAGSILSRTGKCEISSPGGCEIGLRPIDLHLSAIEKFGVNVTEENSKIIFNVIKELNGTDITLSFPSVGATENIILSAVTANGRTVITNAAREPEISDLADFLNRSGARICGAGEGTIVIDGVKKLHGAEHKVIPDRIAASTYMAASALTGGRIEIRNVIPVHLKPVLPMFGDLGCEIKTGSDFIGLTAPKKLKTINTIRTMPYPGFPTDLQAVATTLGCYANSTGIIIETVFENRFKHIAELSKMGAKIRVDGRMAVIEGNRKMNGCTVTAYDLRGGASLLLAGLGCDGVTKIENAGYIKRGYEKIDSVLGSLGADIEAYGEDVNDGGKTE